MKAYLLTAVASFTISLNAGIASWYGEEHRGKRTANGERFDPDKLTAASWHYKFGTKLKVTNLASGKSVIVICNDRGPNKRLKREIDLSHSAFKQIADPKVGLIQVKVEVVK